MKALLLREKNAPLEWVEMPKPEPAPGEALVRVRAAALNHRDVWIQKGQYAGIKTPVVLGSDGAGTVEAVGAQDDSMWIGREVVLNPSLHWGASPKCQGKEYRILGMPDNGTFAEYVTVPVENLVIKPSHLSWAEAAALPLGGLTAYRALFSRADLQAGERVLITGIGGGVATIGAQLAHAAGAEVWATSGSDAKLLLSQTLGVSGGANYRDPDWTKKLLQKTDGFDVIMDSAGGEQFNQLLDLAKPGGRIVFFGGTAGPVPQLSPQKVFWKQLSLLGTTMGHSMEFAGLLELIEKHRIVPKVDRIFPLQEGESAMRHLENGAQMGKVVLDIAI
jgi:zinc-binding alcohol dehydrogenase/oxidoreductase